MSLPVQYPSSLLVHNALLLAADVCEIRAREIRNWEAEIADECKDAIRRIARSPQCATHADALAAAALACARVAATKHNASERAEARICSEAILAIAPDRWYCDPGYLLNA
jgi:hypothetical protein